jgi:hypothetical protein
MQCGIHQASHLIRTTASYGEDKTTGLDHLHLPIAEDHTCNFIPAVPAYLQVCLIVKEKEFYSLRPNIHYLV